MAKATSNINPREWFNADIEKNKWPIDCDGLCISSHDKGTVMATITLGRVTLVYCKECVGQLALFMAGTKKEMEQTDG